MADQKEAELASAPTQQLPAIGSLSHDDTPKFVAEQKRIEDMIADETPLIVILSELVLMIEAPSPEMLCSILLLSEDGNHVRHALRRVCRRVTPRPLMAVRLVRNTAPVERRCFAASRSSSLTLRLIHCGTIIASLPA